MYCTIDDLTARLVAEQLAALADDDGDGAADDSVVAAAIADAQAEIDARLAPRYAVPFETAPAVARAIGATLAIERLYLRRRETPPEGFRVAIDAARMLLDRLASGEADIREDGRSFGRRVSDSTTRGAEKVFRSDDLDAF